MMAHSLKNIAILNAKGDTFRCLLMGISKNKGLKRLKEDCKHEFYIKNWFSLIFFFFFFFFFLIYIKMSEIADLTYYQKTKI